MLRRPRSVWFTCKPCRYTQPGQAAQSRQCQSERQFKFAIVSRHISIVAPYTLGARFTVVSILSMKTSSASQSDSGSPAIGRATHLTASACRHDLWLTAVEAMGKIDMGPVARRFVRGWVAMGVERMQMTDCLSPAYLAIARANLETFVHLMKTEALVQGHAERINIQTLHAAHRQLERKGLLTTFTLWPFWPEECVPPSQPVV